MFEWSAWVEMPFPHEAARRQFFGVAVFRCEKCVHCAVVSQRSKHADGSAATTAARIEAVFVQLPSPSGVKPGTEQRIKCDHIDMVSDSGRTDNTGENAELCMQHTGSEESARKPSETQREGMGIDREAMGIGKPRFYIGLAGGGGGGGGGGIATVEPAAASCAHQREVRRVRFDINGAEKEDEGGRKLHVCSRVPVVFASHE